MVWCDKWTAGRGTLSEVLGKSTRYGVGFGGSGVWGCGQKLVEDFADGNYGLLVLIPAFRV